MADGAARSADDAGVKNARAMSMMRQPGNAQRSLRNRHLITGRAGRSPRSIDDYIYIAILHFRDRYFSR